MAITIAKFIDEKASEEYLCAICRDVMTVPVQIGCNGGHVYCRNCIIQYIQSQPPYNLKCPTCATPFHPNSVFQIPFIQRKINDLQVICPNYESQNMTLEMKTQKEIDKNTNTTNTESPLRRSKRIKEKQTKLSGLKRKQPHSDGEDDDIIILNNKEPLTKKQKLNNNNNNNNNKPQISNDCCEWKGRFGDLQTHINKCPLQLINCRYLTIGCKDKIQRKSIDLHISQCEYCPILCPQCERTTISRGYLENHLAHDCIMTVVKCNECKHEMKRMDLLQHKKKHCGETLIMCEYRNYGCDVIKRKDEKKHNKENIIRHLKLVKDSHNNLENQVNELRRRLEQIERYQIVNNNQNMIENQNNCANLYNNHNNNNNNCFPLTSNTIWHQT